MDLGCDSQIGETHMNSVGIDISKGRSTIAVIRSFGGAVISPFEVRHADSELSKLARQLKSLNSETRVVSHRKLPCAGGKAAPRRGAICFRRQCKVGAWHGNNDLMQLKTDKKGAVKLANYGLDR